MEQSPQVNTAFAATDERFDPTGLRFPEYEISPNRAANGETKISAYAVTRFCDYVDWRLSRQIRVRRPDPTPV